MILDQHHLQCLRNFNPRIRSHDSLLKAAVAIILRDGQNGTEALLMHRAYHDADPWSGQMSFPGGKIESTDECAKAAAVRETFEEVGISLTDADYVGRQDDIYGLRANNVFTVHISCFVFKPQHTLSPLGNHEVADLVWLPLSHLTDPSNAHFFTHPLASDVTMPSVMINEPKKQILWGLTLRMLANLFDVLGEQLTVLSEAELTTLKNMNNLERND